MHCSDANCEYTAHLISFGEYTVLDPRQMHLQSPESQRLSTFFGWTFSDAQKITQHLCPTCSKKGLSCNLAVSVYMQRMPYLNFLRININFEGCTIDEQLAYQGDGIEYTYHPRGVIYSGQGHFVCRIVDNQRDIWFHDGMTTRSSCKKRKFLTPPC